MPFVLSNDLTVNFWITKYTLVQINKLAIRARIDLEILRTLDADSLEELVVESIMGQIEVTSHLGILFISIEDFLSLVSHKAPSTDPKQARVNCQQAVAHVIALGWRLDYL